MNRRRVLSGAPLALLAAVGGCGFHPLYAPGGAAQTGLRDIFVDVIANRNGQELREALQRRVEGTGTDGSKQYELKVSLIFVGNPIGIQPDTSSDRTRFAGTANWTLLKAGQSVKVVSGSAHSLDGANVIDEQFFYSDLSSDAIQHRMAEALADQIVQQLAVYFHTHPNEA
jgi:LPS-assembly lipoprotein